MCRRFVGIVLKRKMRAVDPGQLRRWALHGNRPAGLKTSSFHGIVVDRDALEIRSFRRVERHGCSVTMLLRIRLGEIQVTVIAECRMNCGSRHGRNRVSRRKETRRILAFSFHTRTVFD